MKTFDNLYSEIYNLSNLILAWRKARKHKTKKNYIIEFESDILKFIKAARGIKASNISAKTS